MSRSEYNREMKDLVEDEIVETTGSKEEEDPIDPKDIIEPTSGISSVVGSNESYR